MHELSIASEVLGAVQRAVLGAGASRVVRIHLKVGELASVDPDALAFAYEAVTAGLPLFDGSCLQVAWIPVRVRCSECGVEGCPVPGSVACGACGSFLTEVFEGEELEIGSVEVERDEDPRGDGAEGSIPQR
ncbi:hydrogenase maturation nickel metallochaperone HypA/HybF [Limnochorda pilosa]|uniref:Hydrogenase maturation factor HypA n=1 Tax=Limnochorda pilosa TaxID=1555112 RepID=A0A0K2SHA9_LIMPI|nr:hydrogenase maturation nickel metallochaperone HypA [Limnochorda pilosa]BAS26503.1 hydrogenase nickel incorporation protein HypA [Limnochorda pilosa]